MAKSSKQIVWKSANDQTKWMGFVNGALRFSITHADSKWVVAVPDKWGFFYESHVEPSEGAAKAWAEASL